jgi:hypothetical protein
VSRKKVKIPSKMNRGLVEEDDSFMIGYPPNRCAAAGEGRDEWRGVDSVAVLFPGRSVATIHRV